MRITINVKRNFFVALALHYYESWLATKRLTPHTQPIRCKSKTNGLFAWYCHMVQNPLCWITKECSSLQNKLAISTSQAWLFFVLDVPVRSMPSSRAAFIPCDSFMQRAHFNWFERAFLTTAYSVDAWLAAWLVYLIVLVYVYHDNSKQKRKGSSKQWNFRQILTFCQGLFLVSREDSVITCFLSMPSSSRVCLSWFQLTSKYFKRLQP